MTVSSPQQQRNRRGRKEAWQGGVRRPAAHDREQGASGEGSRLVRTRQERRNGRFWQSGSPEHPKRASKPENASHEVWQIQARAGRPSSCSEGQPAARRNRRPVTRSTRPQFTQLPASSPSPCGCSTSEPQDRQPPTSRSADCDPAKRLQSSGRAKPQEQGTTSPQVTQAKRLKRSPGMQDTTPRRPQERQRMSGQGRGLARVSGIGRPF